LKSKQDASEESIFKLQVRLFHGQSADQLYRAARQRWQKRKRQK
jgi:hypothetical protein